MGKSRKGKNNRYHSSSRANPTGLNSVRSVEEDLESMSSISEAVYEETAEGKTISVTSLQSILEQMQSSTAEERDCACNALASLLRSSQDVKVALSQGVIKILCPLLVDSNPAVRHSSAGALHNLTLLGGEHCCQEAVKEDILTPLIALFKKFPSNWTPNKQVKGEKIDSQTQTFIEAVRVLGNLCESSSKAVDIFYRENLAPIISRCLDLQVFEIEVVLAALQCLYTVTEDFGDKSDASFPAEDLVRGILNGQIPESYSGILLRILALGVLLNLQQGRNNSTPSNAAVVTVAAALKIDHRKAAADLMDTLPAKEQSNGEEVEDSMESDGASAANGISQMKEMQNLLLAQTLSLEILANLCCDQDPNEAYEDVATDEESVSDGSMDIDGMAVDETLNLQPEVHEAVVSLKVFDLVLNKANLPAENVCQALVGSSDQGRSVLEQFDLLRCRAFLCLSNLANILTVEEMGGTELLFTTWCNLGKLAFQSTSSSDLLEAATTAMRSLIRRLADLSSSEQFRTNLEHSDVAAICEAARVSSDPRCKVNLIQITGILGSLAAGTQLPISEASVLSVKSIGQLLLDTVCRDFELWIIAEALDAIFDVFKEDHVDFIAVEIQLVEKLKAALPALKHKIHAQRRRLGDHYPIVMTAKENLIRFIKYKDSQRR